MFKIDFNAVINILRSVFDLLLPLVIPALFVIAFIAFGTSFYKALPLFFKDCFVNIKKAFSGEQRPFNMYGVYLFNGLGGSGKTISMIRKAQEVKERFPNVLIMGNFHCDVVDKYFDSWEDILNTENIDENGVNQGVLILFDEMHLTLNSQSWQNAPDELLEYISLQRHLHKCIFGSAQEWKRVTKIIREQVNFVIDCKSYMKGRLITNKCYTKENFSINGDQKDSGMRKRPKEWKESFVGTDKLRSLYDTDEIVKGLKIGPVSKEEKMSKRIISALQE